MYYEYVDNTKFTVCIASHRRKRICKAANNRVGSGCMIYTKLGFISWSSQPCTGAFDKLKVCIGSMQAYRKA